MICYYCQKNEAKNFSYVNPYTKETHPTCPVCEYEFELLIKDKKKFKLIKIIGNLLFFAGLIGFFSYGWEVGTSCIILGIVFNVAFYGVLGSERVRGKRERLDAQFAKEHGLFSFHSTKYVDPSKIRWCKTCKHYRKVRRYEKSLVGLWTSEKMISDSDIPCKILDEVRDVWESYYALPRRKRFLFPKDCFKWTN